MEKENSPRQKLAEVIKRLEASGLKAINMADKMKAIGFVGGVGAHQKKNQAAPEPHIETGTAPDGE